MQRHLPVCLVVDDDELIVASYARVLSRVAEVLTARSVDEARRVLEAHPVRLVLCDFSMPFQTGDVLFRYARDAQPTARRVMMTGSASGVVRRYVDDGLVHELLEKPAHIDELLALVARLTP